MKKNGLVFSGVFAFAMMTAGCEVTSLETDEDAVDNALSILPKLVGEYRSSTSANSIYLSLLSNGFAYRTISYPCAPGDLSVAPTTCRKNDSFAGKWQASATYINLYDLSGKRVETIYYKTVGNDLSLKIDGAYRLFIRTSGFDGGIVPSTDMASRGDL